MHLHNLMSEMRLDPTPSRPYLGAMLDPRTPEILAWVDAMPIAERLTVMRAMSFAFPMLKNDRAWKVRIVRAPGGGSDQIKKSPDGGGAQVGRLLRRTPPPIMLRTTQIPSCDADHVRALFFGRFSPE